MPEEKAILEAAKALGIEALLPTVYDDLLSPAARELGDGLATIAKAVKISLAPVEAAVWGYEKIREWLSTRVTSLLAERRAKEIQPPPLSVAGPLVFQILFASEEPDLREMYAKLLATSMDGATSDAAHPSFVTVIQQLTSDEARILRHLASLNEKWPFWRGDQESGELESAMRQMCAGAGITDAVKADIYVENLLRLRILRRFTSSEAEYHPEGYNRYGDYGASISTYNSEFIEITCYGRALLEACVMDNVVQKQ
jgi:hypothetical protein